MKKIMVALAFSIFGLSQVAGCGSGSTVSLPQQKTAQLVFSASTSAALPTAVRVIKISAHIPSGVTVPLVANSRQEVDPGALIAFKQGSSVFGRYSAPLLTISVTGDVTPSSLGLGTDNVRDFAGVLLSYQAGSSLTAGSFTSINPSFPNFTAFGFVSNNQVDLTGTLKPAMRVIF